MPTEEAVCHYADMILARGERPSLRKLREEIPAGGSPLEVCKHSHAWRKKRGYNPNLEPADMSNGMKEAGHALAMDLWKQAKKQANQAFARERAAAVEMASDEKGDREHLLGMLETLQAENAALASTSASGHRADFRISGARSQLWVTPCR